MKAIAVLAAAVAALALAATASAKELKQLNTCGASGCRTTTDRDLLLQVSDEWRGTLAPSSVTSYYAIEFTVDVGRREPMRWIARYYPAQDLIRVGRKSEDVTWYGVPPDQLGAFRELTQGLRPFAPDGTGAPAASPRDDGFPWVVLLFSLALAAVVGCVAVVNGRRRAPEPAPGS
jgi:hypothetical protein